MAVISMKALLETGVHFGHRTRKWNPRMKPFIFTERNGIHIIDLQQTLESLETGYALIRDQVASGGTLLFVGTKRQAQETIQTEAARCGMPYVNSRWLGGTLTNWRTIRSRIDELDLLEKRREGGQSEHLTKKESLIQERKIERLQERLGGIRSMRALPGLLFVVDVKREETAIHEANLLGIGVIALVDTNCDPRGVDYVIPSNDDAIRAIKLLTAKIADAVLEGKALRKEEVEEEVEPGAERQVAAGLDLSDEELLGEATLAKLQSGAFGEEGRVAPVVVDSDEPEVDIAGVVETADEEVVPDVDLDDEEVE
ncbi:MAG: 30S ribosomal protein S2 [Chloroflexi bacterium RBG_19FT_COMBO_62_14]|nr:MAG: 30S ribosomal protein S2 [Chloroflexi bacterium RBG_19FT_COMBO_62_14]